jgi:hypothetical protein
MTERFIPADEIASQMGSGVDPANTALMEALAQIRQAQAQPLLSQDPISQLGVSLQGIAAGYRGEPNPAVQQALAIRQQQLGSAQQGFQNQLGLANLGLQTQQVKNQTSSENRRDLLDRLKLQEQTTDKMIENPNRAVRLYGYQQKMKTPIEYGGLPPGSDPEKLANYPKSELEGANDAAVWLMTVGENPRDPKWGGRFDHVPVEQYASLIAANPLAARGLLKKPGTEADFLKFMGSTIRSLPPGTQTEIQQRALAAIEESTPVNYGFDVNRMGGALASTDPTFGQWNPKAPRPDQLAKISEALLEERKPGLERLVQAIQKEKDPVKRAALVEQKNALIAATAEAAGQRTAAVVGATPMNETQQKIMAGHLDNLSVIAQFKAFTAKEINTYTGILKNPVERAKMFYQANAPAALGGGAVDEKFAQFEALMGLFQKGYFALGGKQLTPFEATVARMSTPTGREKGGAVDMLAKIDYLEKFTKISMEVTKTLAATGKSKLLEPEFFDNLLKGAMLKAGMRLPGDATLEPWRSTEPPKGNWKRVGGTP